MCEIPPISRKHVDLQYADSLNLSFEVIELIPEKPIVIMTLVGREPEIGSVILNSHMDVVPVFEESWSCNPFEGKILDGKIYGRGTQDMKSVSIQYLEAMRRLKSLQFRRTIHLLFIPDEEIGGFDGMQLFVKSEKFRSLNASVVLDEGLANPENKYTIFYGERAPWWINVTCVGNTGHGSQFIKDTATEKLLRVIEKVKLELMQGLILTADLKAMRFRTEEMKKFESCGCKHLGDVTTVNLTMLKCGIQHNVVPAVATAGKHNFIK